MGAGLTVTGCLLVCHGTRSATGADEAWRFRAGMAAARPTVPVVTGYIELLEPDLDGAVDRLVAAGAGDVVAVPLLLAGARHTTADVPAALDRSGERHPTARFTIAAPLGGHPTVLRVLDDRVTRAALGLDGAVDAVVLAGRGSSDATADLGGVADRLAARLTTGSAPGDGPPVVPAFAAATQPDIPTALERCRLLGARRIVVAPFLLFHGSVVEQVAAQVDRWAVEHPGTAVATAGHLGPDGRLMDAAWALVDAAIDRS